MRSKSTIVMIVVFIAGVAVGALARGRKVESSIFSGKSKADAGRALLEEAKSEAGKGSWENIAVGRVYYLGGHKSDGQAIFDAVANKKASDWMRIGRIYMEAHEWSKAKEVFDKAVTLEPKDAAWLAEVGALYNMQGDRAKAEELFTRSLAAESGEVWYTINMAGSYMGVEPRGNS
jgi:tetratricopeptide (TPR) repeat protein